MASEPELLSTEIVNQGIVQGSGPDAGSLSFSIRVRRRLPDFLNSVNLKHVRLGYTYLINHGYLLVAPLVVLIVGAQIGKLTWEELGSRYNITDTTSLVGLMVVLIYLYLDLTPRSTYLVDFSCYLPPNDLKVSKDKFLELAKQSGNFNDSSLDFMNNVLKKSGIGEETYLPRTIFTPGHKITLKDGRKEAAMVMFGAVDELLAATGIQTNRIRILVVNCGILNTTPSLSAMIINHYKLRHDIHSFNLGGMGCAAGVIAIDLARDLLNAHPGSYALVVSTEVTSYTWYMGKDKDMLLPNCFLRMGAAAMFLSNRRIDRWRSKYELKQLVRTHRGMDNDSFQCIHKKEDAEGKQGLSVNKDILEIGGHALKANITTLGPLVLPFSEQLLFFKTLLSRNTKPYIPNYKLAFEHICILAASKKVLDELQKNLELTDEYMEASRMTLSRFGNTSSSSVWYELAYLEANNKIKQGDRIWQVTFGSGFKCNSVVWKALKSIRKTRKTPWTDDSM